MRPEPLLSDRSHELEQLVRILRTVANGRSATCLITGEAGIGKSRLISEFLSIARAEESVVIAGRALDFDQRYAYSTLNDMLASVYRHELATEPRRHLDALVSVTDTWRTSVEGPDGNASGEPIIALLTKFLRAISTDKVCIIVIDDAHCADDESLQKVCLAFRHLATRPVLLLCAARNDKWIAGSGFAATVGRLVEERSGTVIELPRLNACGTRELIQSTLSARPDDQLTDYVLRQSLGNPLFAGETIEALQSADLLVVEDGCIYLPAAPQFNAVNRRSALLHRIFQQDEDSREMARFLSVFGPVRLEHLDLVAGLSGFSPMRLQRAFDGLCEAGILTRGQDGAYRFAHPLVAEVLYEDVGPIERRRLHRDIAQRLAGQSPRFSAVQWAIHVVEGADSGDSQAIEAALKMATSLHNPAPLAAAAWYGRAIELCDSDSRSMAAAFRSSQAVAYWKGSRPQAAIEVGLEAIEVLPRGRDYARTLSTVINALYATNRHTEALDLLDRTVHKVDLPGTFLAQRALLLDQLGRPDEAARQFDEVSGVIDEGATENEVVTYTHLAHAASSGRSWDEARPWVDRLIAIGSRAPERADLGGSRLAALESAAYIYGEVGLLQEAQAMLTMIAVRSPAEARDIGGQIAYAQVVTQYLAGDWNKALESIHRAAVALDFAGLANNLGWLRVIEVDILTEQGKYDEADRVLRQHVEYLDGGRFACENAILAARIAIGRGDHTDALASLSAQSEVARVHGWQRAECRALEGLAFGHLDAGDREGARLAALGLKRLATGSKIPKFRWSAALTNALAFDDSRCAETLLDYALSEGLGFLAARAQYALAILRGDDIDLLKRAMARFDHMDARPWRQRVLDRLQQSRAGHAPTDSPEGGVELDLSDIERRLISMVRDGLNNREIATSLHYSRKTVEAYLSRLYRKFGCRSRVGLIVALERAGIADTGEASS